MDSDGSDWSAPGVDRDTLSKRINDQTRRSGITTAGASKPKKRQVQL